MKKIIFILIITFISSVLFAKTYTLKNSYMMLQIEVRENNATQITSIKDLTTGQEFLDKVIPTSSLWSFNVKKDKDYSGKSIELKSSNAESVEVKQNKDSLILKYKNVTCNEIKDKFDVVCNVNLVGNNSYWDIEISKGSEYGIWDVTYPFVYGLNCLNGDNFYMPFHGDVFVTEFDNPKGFLAPYSDKPDFYTKHFEWQTPVMVQYTSLTKGKSTFYYTPQDTSVVYKNFQIHYNEPNNMSVYIAYTPENTGIAGYGYKQKNKHNISVMKGDWFTAAKKYRKWGIENKYAGFVKGPLEERKDVPQWWKDLCVCTQGWVRNDDVTNSIIRTQKEFEGIPLLYQVYGLNGYTFDTHYPKFLPFDEKGLNNLKKIKEAGVKLMPYTNGRLADKALNEEVKNNPDNYLVKDEKGNYYYESWAKDAGADENMACIGSDYYYTYLNEITEMFKTFPFDALYMDQVGGCVGYPCFNENHNHPVGGGDYFVKGYNSLLKDLKKSYKEVTGEDLVIATENGGDAIEYDGWLKCNENSFKSENNKVRGVIYSGYVQNYGNQMLNNKIYEYDKWECFSVINFFATTLTKGYILGFEGFDREVFWSRKYLSKYAKNAVLARNSVKEFFNFGEMVRDINITSKIPKIHVAWTHYTNRFQEVDADTIKTCSYNYNGKSMICITNCGKEATKVVWNSKPEDLYLKKKSSYTISQVFPEKKVINSNVKKISGEITIESLDTIILIVE